MGEVTSFEVISQSNLCGWVIDKHLAGPAFPRRASNVFRFSSMLRSLFTFYTEFTEVTTLAFHTTDTRVRPQALSSSETV